MIGIYKITSPSNKVYIGQSIDVENRLKRYKYFVSKKQTRLYYSILKYGYDNHTYEVVEECKVEELNERERYWQDFYDCLNNGLNCRLTTTKDISGYILTGKTKEDFFNWLDNQGVNGIDISNWEFEKFHLLSNVSQNALIIEWFDSVGIYITSDYFELNKGFYSEILDSNFAIVKPTRQEALTEAIKKANEIYNEKICQI